MSKPKIEAILSNPHEHIRVELDLKTSMPDTGMEMLYQLEICTNQIARARLNGTGSYSTFLIWVTYRLSPATPLPEPTGLKAAAPPGYPKPNDLPKHIVQ